MKHKIKTDIHKTGEHSETILKAVAAHNEGIRLLTPLDICSYLRVREAVYSCTTCDLGYLDPENTSIVSISKDKGKTFSLTLEWIEVHELQPVKESNNDLPDALFSVAIAKELTKNEL